MKITVVGGSKGTGAQFAKLAHQAGHAVTLLSRSGQAPSGVRALAGDATDAQVVRDAVAGADAVVLTVGAAKKVPHQRALITQTVIAAMHDAGVRRLVVQSSLGAGNSGSQMPGFLRFAMLLMLAKPLADHNTQENYVSSSGLDWTIVRPTGLTNKEATGSWKALTVSDAGMLGGTITRSDLAAFLLHTLDDKSSIGQAIGISNG